MSITPLFLPTSPPGSGDIDPSARIAAIATLAPLAPFSPGARAFIADFVQRIRALPGLRAQPELATLAHWFRPAAVDALAERFFRGGARRPARGTVFHLAPANVDVLFAYAWLISLAIGNVNIARLSQKPGAARDALLAILRAMADAGAHPEVLARTALVTYPHDASITAALSRRCDARIVWGGDATVAAIRAVPLAPLAVELCFPDRFGIAAFRAAAVADLDDAALATLAERFANDVLTFGQQACSSPRTLYWVGTPAETDAARRRFWPGVQAASARFDDEPAALIARVTDACVLAARGMVQHRDSPFDALPLRVDAASADGHARDLQGGHGLVAEVRLDDLATLATQVDPRDQTLVQFGFDAAALDTLLAALPNRGIDRIVGPGRALDFHTVWDGNDLYATLAREVTVSGTG
jgi:hypothetical protein